MQTVLKSGLISEIYTPRETYYITRDQNGRLHGRFEGLRTFDPQASNFKPRDTEARDYWDTGCLI